MKLVVGPLFAELSAVTAFVGNGIVLAAVAGMVAYAWKQGLFVATVVALGCLAAFTLALAGVATMSRYLVDVEVPADLAPAAAYALVFGGALLALRAACGRWLPEQALWMGGFASRVAACFIGGIAGSFLAAAVLIGWTMVPLPASLALRAGELFWDPGPWALKVFSRCVESDRDRRGAILGSDGTRGRDVRPDCSEPFYDENNNCLRDETERYIDCNQDRQFTQGTGVGSAVAWQPGLLDHYRLAAWRHVRASHSPRISSDDAVSVDFSSLGEGVYHATATDPDTCDALTFSLSVDSADGDSSLTIDPATGLVMLADDEAAEPRPKYVFRVTATDKAGLTDSRPVTVTIKGLPNLPEKP